MIWLLLIILLIAIFGIGTLLEATLSVLLVVAAVVAAGVLLLGSAVARRASRGRPGSTRRFATLGGVTTIDLRTVRLRSGEQLRTSREVGLEGFDLGGQRYVPLPDRPHAAVTISRTTSGLLFELELEARLVGPCVRCLVETAVTTATRGREYHSAAAGAEDELRTPYVVDERLDLSTWARDAVALALPDKILCRPDCAGLCPVCGADLNVEPHAHEEAGGDPRWAALAELRDRL
jgi:uncharacterized protein